MKARVLNIIMVIVMGVLTITACSQKAEYEGTYAGTMPCADCAGIYTEITLDNNNYTIKRVYQGKGDENANTFVDKGSYTWDKTNHVLTFDADPSSRYRVEDKTLIALDMNGNQVTGSLASMYILRKK